MNFPVQILSQVEDDSNFILFNKHIKKKNHEAELLTSPAVPWAAEEKKITLNPALSEHAKAARSLRPTWKEINYLCVLA